MLLPEKKRRTAVLAVASGPSKLRPRCRKPPMEGQGRGRRGRCGVAQAAFAPFCRLAGCFRLAITRSILAPLRLVTGDWTVSETGRPVPRADFIDV